MAIALDDICPKTSVYINTLTKQQILDLSNGHFKVLGQKFYPGGDLKWVQIQIREEIIYLARTWWINSNLRSGIVIEAKDMFSYCL